MTEAFRRINYFKGFFVQAEDLRQAESYHIEKLRLHNRCLHTPGVVANCLQGLAVSAVKDGTHVRVAPGCAMDGSGRELLLPAACDLPLNPKDYNPPIAVYVVISYAEKKVEWRPDKENPEFEGYAFIAERPKCEVVVSAPDTDEKIKNHEMIELARISLGADEMRISDPNDKDSPKENEIDCRHVKTAAAIPGPQKIEALRHEKIEVLRHMKIEGSIDVQPTETQKEIEDPPRALLEKLNVENVKPTYLVSVFPLEKGHITWQMEAFSNRPNTVEYRLSFRNFGDKTVKVRWRAYRFDL